MLRIDNVVLQGLSIVNREFALTSWQYLAYIYVSNITRTYPHPGYGLLRNNPMGST